MLWLLNDYFVTNLLLNLTLKNFEIYLQASIQCYCFDREWPVAKFVLRCVEGP